MLTYTPGSFSTLYATDLGRRLWEFLNRDEIVARLETASELGKPAVEGISEQLLDAFREDALPDRVKQMIGHMTRQVMEHHGWEIDLSQVRILGVPFAKGARYRRPGGFTLHAFRNVANPSEFALVNTRQPKVLPEGSQWTYQAKITSKLQAAVAYQVTDLSRVLDDIREIGFYVAPVVRILHARPK